MISFIIPVFNSGQYLENCFQKIKDVKLPDYEVIIVDDGSTDNSDIICDKLASENDAVICIHQQNQGVSVARNRGIDVATGEFIIFIDADDSFEPEHLHNLIKKLDNEPGVDMVIWGLSFDYYHNGKLYRRDEIETPLSGIYERDQWNCQMVNLYHTNSLSPVWNKMIRRSILVQKGIYFRRDMFLYEDLEFSLQCMSHCDHILFEPTVIYRYRQSEDEGNAGRRLNRIKKLTDVVSQINEAFEESVSSEQKNEILLSLYLTLAREKISVSSRKEISVVCDDFSKWYETGSYQLKGDAFINKLLNHKVGSLRFKSKYTVIRHRIAILVKSTALYQKRRG